jgi:manganese-dependent inorganic pyrophosphatase
MSITVLGHINPDTDTTCAAIAYAWFLQQHSTPATAVRTGTLNKETSLTLEHFGFAQPELIERLTSDHQIAIVDTNNPDELVPGWNEATIVSIVDHHKLSGLKTAGPVEVFMKPVACTCTIILELMEMTGIQPNRAVAGIMLAAIISDTLHFTSPTTTQSDRDAAATLAVIAESDIATLAENLFAAKSDISDMSPADILTVDSKVYGIGDERLLVASFETTNPGSVYPLSQELIAAMESVKKEQNLTGVLLFVVDILQSNAMLIVPTDHERALASKAFAVDFNQEWLELPGIVSRKKQIMPKFEAILGQL